MHGEHLRLVLAEKQQYQDHLVSLETTNAELRAALKVEKMLRLKNFNVAKNGIVARNLGNGFQSPDPK